MKRGTARLGTWTWVLVYGGLFAATVGFSLLRQGQSYGWLGIASGGVCVVAGAVMIWLRSRLPDSAEA